MNYFNYKWGYYKRRNLHLENGSVKTKNKTPRAIKISSSKNNKLITIVIIVFAKIQVKIKSLPNVLKIS